MKLRRASRTLAQEDTYPQRVLEVIADHFDLDEVAQDVIVEAVRRQRLVPSAGFEVIVDNPHAANWRLRPHREDPSRVRLGDYRMPLMRGDRKEDPRQIAVNKALDRLA